MTQASPGLRPLAPCFFAGNRQRLADEAARADADGFLVLAPDNVVYATGFFHAANERPIALYVPARGGDPVLLVPLLERDHAAEFWDGGLDVYRELSPARHPVRGFLGRQGARRVACDGVPADLASALADDGIAAVVSHALIHFRAIKTEEELALTRAAARVADRCLEAILEDGGAIVRRGGTERDLLAHGLQAATAFLTSLVDDRFALTKCAVVGTVHSGPRAALPHGKTIDRLPQAGEPVIAGIGAAVGGYHAESGATFVISGHTAETRRAFAAMTAADRVACGALVSGGRCEAADAVANAALCEAGFADDIRHRIGHGMGLQNHEPPWLTCGDSTIVAPGMVFSCEPGIYRPGRDGYRTINTFIVGHEGVEIPSTFLTRCPPEARVLPS